MIDISGILESKNADISYEALRKTELLCEKAAELSDKYFTTGKPEYLNDAVDILTQAALVNFRYSRIYISLCHTCLRLELFKEAKALLDRVIEFDHGNLIARNMQKIVNAKISSKRAANKKGGKASARPAANFSGKFSGAFLKKFHSINLKAKIIESNFRKLTKIFYRE